MSEQEYLLAKLLEYSKERWANKSTRPFSISLTKRMPANRFP